jgi:ASC-1-like (ASCH) protein
VQHDLKTINPYFSLVLSGEKTCEVRLNDRNFQVGDTLLLREYGEEGLTGRTHTVRVTHILSGEHFVGVRPGWVVMSFRNVSGITDRVR